MRNPMLFYSIEVLKCRSRLIRYRHYKAGNGNSNERFIVLYRKRWYLFHYASTYNSQRFRVRNRLW